MYGSHQTHVEISFNVQESAKLRKEDRLMCGGCPQCTARNARKSAELRAMEISKVKGQRQVDV